MKDFLMVAVGGLLGTVGRYGIQVVSTNCINYESYWATLITNLIGCLLVGIFAGTYFKLSQNSHFLLITGFCGGFTTFSTFAFDGIKLIRTGLYSQFLIYFFISAIGGMILCLVGLMIISR